MNKLTFVVHAFQPSTGNEPDLSKYTEEIIGPIENGNLLMDEESQLQLELGLSSVIEGNEDA